MSSPHSVKYFGDQNPPKMGICDQNWIIICFSSISMNLECKKGRNKLTGPFLLAGPSLAKQGLKPSRSMLWHQTMFLEGKTLLVYFYTFSCYSTHRYLSNDVRSMSIRVRMKKLCHSEVDLPVLTPIIKEDAASTPIIHGKQVSHMFLM